MTKHPTLAERSGRGKVIGHARTAPPPADPMAEMQATLQRMNTDLRADGGLPTLADRIAVEGYAAQLGKEKPKRRLRSVRSPK